MATKTDDDELVVLEGDTLPDGEHLATLRNLLGAAVESVGDTSSAILGRVNEKTDGEVTYELVGRLALFAGHVREHAEWLLRDADLIEGSLDDLSMCIEGSPLSVPRFDESGREQRDSLTRWRNTVSDALGIERFTGGYSKQNAEAFAARTREVDDA